MKYFFSTLLLSLTVITLSGCYTRNMSDPGISWTWNTWKIAEKIVEKNIDDLEPKDLKNISQSDVKIIPWIDGLDTPWELVFLDDNRAIVSQRPGIISLIQNWVIIEEPYWEAPSREYWEGGLMWLEKDPEYSKNWFIYAMYASDWDKNKDWYTTKVVRLKENSNGIIEINWTLIDNIPAAKYHDGGRIKFWPDQKLYVTTGDATNPDLAQNLSSLAGKILRVNSDGSIPEDNPFANSLVYSYGHRNPQWLAWNNAWDLFMSTHGPSWEFGLKAKDRVDYITAWTNYWWPEAYGPGQWFPDPIAYWPDSATPPGGMVFWNTSLYLATMKSEALIKLDIVKNESWYSLIWESKWFEWEYGRLRNIIKWPDWNLYLMTTNADGRWGILAGKDKIYQISIK